MHDASTRKLLGRFARAPDSKLDPLSPAETKQLRSLLDRAHPGVWHNVWAYNAIMTGNDDTWCTHNLRGLLADLATTTSLHRIIRNGGRIAPLLQAWGSGNTDVFDFGQHGHDGLANHALLSDSCVCLHVLLVQHNIPKGSDGWKMFTDSLRPLVKALGDFLLNLWNGALACRVCAHARRARTVIGVLSCRRWLRS